MTYFFKILHFTTPYRKYIVGNVFFNMLYAFFNALSFLALMPMLEVLFGENKSLYVKPQYKGITELKTYFSERMNYEVTLFAGEDPQRALLLVISAVLVTFFLKNLFNYAALFFITFLRNGVLKDLRNALQSKVINLPLSHYSETKKGDIISRITADVQEVQQSFLSMLELIFREPLTIIFALFMMFAISPKLTLIVLVFIPIAGFLISRVGKSLKPKSDKVQRELGELLANVEETMGGLRIIKAFVAEEIFHKRFQKITQRFFRFSNSLMNRQNLASPLSEFLGVGVIGFILWYGGSLVLVEKTMTPSSFIAYMGLAYGVLTPAKGISKAAYSVKKGNAAAERIIEILETNNPIQDKENAFNVKYFHDRISLQNISFAYEEVSVIDNISLEIPKGKTIALVGQSGSGKTTLANLIPRFYDIQKGSIKIDGNDIRMIRKSDLRSLMGIVTQESILFHDSVKNNLLLAKPNASDKEIYDAAAIANAHDFISELPQGYDTIIGDGGNKLSGGQKQRLSIARAVLKNPPIMILDEATSALDTESERMVQNALTNMMKNRTSLVIAHRLSTIQNADLIVVMQKGKIAEQGKHQELTQANGVYKKLIELQSFQ